MLLAQKYRDAPKMLNQASLLQHFLIPTASNGSPLKVLLRRGFARRELSEQTWERAHRDGKVVANGFGFSGSSAGFMQEFFSVSSNYHKLWKILALAQKSPAMQGSSAKHERQGGRRSKSKSTWFSASGSVSALSEPCVSLCTLRL